MGLWISGDDGCPCRSSILRNVLFGGNVERGGYVYVGAGAEGESLFLPFGSEHKIALKK